MEFADECIILNAKGRVAECGSGNVFIQDGKKLITPARVEGPILGILRDGLVQALNGIGIRVLESKITVKDLMIAPEVFRSSTIGGITPISKIETKTVGTSTQSEAISFIKEITDKLIFSDYETPW
jgi:branched-chain amino acid aminotransferase